MIIDSLKTIIKFTVVLGLAAVFLLALNTIIAFVVPLVVPPIVSEVLATISMFLPFNASAVFSAIGYSCEVVLVFMVANKVFNLNTWLIHDA